MISMFVLVGSLCFISQKDQNACRPEAQVCGKLKGCKYAIAE